MIATRVAPTPSAPQQICPGLVSEFSSRPCSPGMKEVTNSEDILFQQEGVFETPLMGFSHGPLP